MSRLPFELFLALRYLRPKRTFVSVITLISIIGVMLGVAVLIIVISVMSGFDRQLRDKILGFNAHMRVYGMGPITNYNELAAIIRTNTHVRGVAPYILGQVLVQTQPPEGLPSRVLAPVVRGIDPELESKMTKLPQSMAAGEFNVDGYGVVIGSGLAAKLDLRIGELLLIHSVHDLQRMHESRKQGEDTAILPDEYEVRGIFDVGHYEYNNLYILCSLEQAQQLYGFPNGEVHGLLVMVDDPEAVTPIRNQLFEALPPGVEVDTWMDENGDVLAALAVEKNVMFYILFFITIVAAFGITSALITFVVQKTREIGMLKALGATSPQVMMLFLGQSFVVGVLGVTAGFAMGILAVSYRNEFLLFMRNVTGMELFPASIYVFSELPALIVPGDIAIICGGSLIICIFAGLLPAWNAGRLQPIDALRHD